MRRDAPAPRCISDARGIVDGDRVQVANDRGAFKGVARITEEVKAGIVVATLG